MIFPILKKKIIMNEILNLANPVNNHPASRESISQIDSEQHSLWLTICKIVSTVIDFFAQIWHGSFKNEPISQSSNLRRNESHPQENEDRSEKNEPEGVSIFCHPVNSENYSSYNINEPASDVSLNEKAEKERERFTLEFTNNVENNFLAQNSSIRPSNEDNVSTDKSDEEFEYLNDSRVSESALTSYLSDIKPISQNVFTGLADPKIFSDKKLIRKCRKGIWASEGNSTDHLEKILEAKNFKKIPFATFTGNAAKPLKLVDRYRLGERFLRSELTSLLIYFSSNGKVDMLRRMMEDSVCAKILTEEDLYYFIHETGKNYRQDSVVSAYDGLKAKFSESVASNLF